ncbi:hypothetical protein K457DRAFT_33427 [Linnemannia elongata AG-77]|uniref:F-box domain-containing protein n=1 Tax=Linnemannia elongata AG-77 TaxID=1314771 RepID=A0A197JRX2_9FUNG|nr:hypothetical protein K457DRAFT_33427 [Linnemannia elongata AG-77]
MRPTLPTTMLTISENNILPEILERIAHFLDPHSLTASFRVCRFWLDCLLPSLYHTIDVYHFNYLSTTQDARYPHGSDVVVKTAETCLIGLECVNLARVTTVIPVPDWRNLELRAIPEGVKEHKSGQDRNVMETLMAAGGTLTVKTFHSRFSNSRQDVRSLESYAQITNEPKTQIKTLDFFSSWRIRMRP